MSTGLPKLPLFRFANSCDSEEFSNLKSLASELRQHPPTFDEQYAYRDGSFAYATSYRQLERCASINADGVAVCLGPQLEEPDRNSERILCESLGYALAQVSYVLRPLQLHTIDLELAYAAAKVEGWPRLLSSPSTSAWWLAASAKSQIPRGICIAP